VPSLIVAETSSAFAGRAIDKYRGPVKVVAGVVTLGATATVQVALCPTCNADGASDAPVFQVTATTAGGGPNDNDVIGEMAVDDVVEVAVAQLVKP
jgi:hypothetical protein